MTSTATRAADQTARAAGAQLAARAYHSRGVRRITDDEPRAARPVGDCHRRRARSHERQARSLTQARYR